MSCRVVVTGASSGIGRSLALLLAGDGHSLVLTARREAELRALADACLVGGASAVSVVVGDIADPDTASQLVDAVLMCGEGEVVLVNNAGGAEFGTFHELAIEGAVRMVDVGLTGAMRATHALVPLMIEAGGGAVVNVLSVAVEHTFAGAEAYSASKAGLRAFGNSLSASYRSQGVRVTNVIPGAVDTQLWDTISGHPDRGEMLTAKAVAETIKYVIGLPRDRVVDEIAVTPPKGIL